MILVYQPKRVRDPECVEELRKYNADVMVVVAFGQYGKYAGNH